MTGYHISFIENPRKLNARTFMIHSEATLDEVAGMVKRLLDKKMLKYPIPEGEKACYPYPKGKHRRVDG